ncbi:MAG: UvrD-helicase domain-containing protein, partial [Elusimicrobia bacterium]|nr:UvrD-helicase domain-containing protein [Elusimicrobiota bacterium]
MELAGLNERQGQAVLGADGPVAIIAGPGTGKTRTLASRIAYLIQEKKTAPENILAVTFTKNAAQELRERVVDLIDQSTAPRQNFWIQTFHAAAQRILKAEDYFPKKDWIIATDEEKLGLARSLVSRKDLRKFLEANSRRKERFFPPENEAQAHYQSRLLAMNRLDFDDLL